MRIEFEVPDVSGIPVWGWIVGGVIGWYLLTAVFFRWCMPINPTDTTAKKKKDRTDRATFWVFSPVILSVATVWIVLSTFSLGMIPYPWQED